MLSAAPGRLGRSLLAHAGHTSYAPITGLRVLGGLASRLGFLRTAAFLLFTHMLGFRNTLLRQTPTGRTFLRWHKKSGQPGAFLDVFLHLLNRGSYGTETGATSKARVVMHADNMVKVGRIILDGISAKWTA